MLKAFNTLVKPASDELGRLLGEKVPIQVTDKTPYKWHVKVYIPMVKPNGSVVKIPSDRVRDYEVLGLSIRRTI